MRTIEAKKTGDMMAIWRATGGALDTTAARPETVGDDGLRTTMYSRSMYCGGDDGLRTGGYSISYCTDDEL